MIWSKGPWADGLSHHAHSGIAPSGHLGELRLHPNDVARSVMEELPRTYSGEGICECAPSYQMDCGCTVAPHPISPDTSRLRTPSPGGEAGAFPKTCAALRTSDRRLEELASLERNGERRRVGFSAVRRNIDGTRPSERQDKALKHGRWTIHLPGS